ncbi:MAG: hypothetical protein ABIK09_05895 [Pseudomonadota bacterium]
MTMGIFSRDKHESPLELTLEWEELVASDEHHTFTLTSTICVHPRSGGEDAEPSQSWIRKEEERVQQRLRRHLQDLFGANDAVTNYREGLSEQAMRDLIDREGIAELLRGDGWQGNGTYEIVSLTWQSPTLREALDTRTFKLSKENEATRYMILKELEVNRLTAEELVKQAVREGRLAELAHEQRVKQFEAALEEDLVGRQANEITGVIRKHVEEIVRESHTAQAAGIREVLTTIDGLQGNVTDISAALERHANTLRKEPVDTLMKKLEGVERVVVELAAQTLEGARTGREYDRVAALPSVQDAIKLHRDEVDRCLVNISDAAPRKDLIAAVAPSPSTRAIQMTSDTRNKNLRRYAADDGTTQHRPESLIVFELQAERAGNIVAIGVGATGEATLLFDASMDLAITPGKRFRLPDTFAGHTAWELTRPEYLKAGEIGKETMLFLLFDHPVSFRETYERIGGTIGTPLKDGPLSHRFLREVEGFVRQYTGEHSASMVTILAK